MVDVIDAAVIARIQSSPLTITLVYAAASTVPTGAAPAAAPANPLTGAQEAVVIDPAAATETTEDLACLWMDVATGAELSDRTNPEAIRFAQVGWVAEATALARVLVSEAALDTTNPYKGTKFDKAVRVEHFGQRYRVLQVVPFGSGSKLPVTYHVWLVGNK